MGLLNKGLTIINFDETYSTQSKLQYYLHDSIDFQQMKHVNLYCEEDSSILLRKKLQKRKQKGITLIGSGNYHYVSYLLLKEIKNPFTLILFDHHPDLRMSQDKNKNLLSCGSWVSYALSEIPLLQKAIIIGPTTHLPHYSNNTRAVIFPFDGLHQFSLKSILSTIHTQNVYISIDKDVLQPTEVVTNWDQGIMTIEILTRYLEFIIKSKQVEGVDICGEAHLSPLDSLLPENQAIIQKNEKANLKILQALFQADGHQIKGA